MLTSAGSRWGRKRPEALIGVSQYIIVAADESDADNTLHNDAELLFAVGANEIWLVELILHFSSGTSNTPDVLYDFTYPASATLTTSSFGLTLAATTNTTFQLVGEFQKTTPSTSLPFGVLTSTATPTSPLFLASVLRTAGTAGTLQFQWAQNTTTGGTPTLRKKDSWMRYTRIA